MVQSKQAKNATLVRNIYVGGHIKVILWFLFHPDIPVVGKFYSGWVFEGLLALAFIAMTMTTFFLARRDPGFVTEQMILVEKEDILPLVTRRRLWKGLKNRVREFYYPSIVKKGPWEPEPDEMQYESLERRLEGTDPDVAKVIVAAAEEIVKRQKDKKNQREERKRRLEGDDGYCYKCNVGRPTRSWHCRKCGFCVARYDHHCMWLASCVGEKNHGAFVTFLLFQGTLTLYGIYQLARALPPVTGEGLLGFQLWAESNITAVLTLAFVVAVFLTCFVLGAIHLKLLAVGETSFESYRPGALQYMRDWEDSGPSDDQWPFDQGPRLNFISYMAAWLLLPSGVFFAWRTSHDGPAYGAKFAKACSCWEKCC